jgi:hypothetical protein
MPALAIGDPWSGLTAGSPTRSGGAIPPNRAGFSEPFVDRSVRVDCEETYAEAERSAAEDSGARPNSRRLRRQSGSGWCKKSAV